jgi:hypothetical protein
MTLRVFGRIIAEMDVIFTFLLDAKGGTTCLLLPGNAVSQGARCSAGYFQKARELAKRDTLFDGKAAGSSSSGSPKTFAANTRDKDKEYTTQ